MKTKPVLDNPDDLDTRIEPILRTVRAWQQTRADSNKAALWSGLCADLKLMILRAQQDAAKRTTDELSSEFSDLMRRLFSPERLWAVEKETKTQ